MSGTIKVGSEQGKGSVFSVFPADGSTFPATSRAGFANLHGLRALVVDDNATNRCVVTHYLEHGGIAFDVAESASDALESARSAAARR